MSEPTEEELAIARGDVIEDPSAKQEKDAAEAAKVAADEAAKAEEETKKAQEAEDALKKDEEGEETAEEKAEREKAEAEEAAKKRVRIPLARHEAILEGHRQREESLKARIAELESKTAAPKQEQRDALAEMKAQIDALQDKYEAHVFEGEKDEAKKVRSELDALRDKLTDAKMALSSNVARLQTIETLKYEQALAGIEAAYPALNPEHEDFDETKDSEVAELMGMFQKNGLTRNAALEKAVKYVMGTPAAKKEAEVDDTAKTLAEKKAKEAREKAAKAAAAQPPDGSKVGKDNDKGGESKAGVVDFSKITQAQLDKMDEETLARARGDYV